MDMPLHLVYHATISLLTAAMLPDVLSHDIDKQIPMFPIHPDKNLYEKHFRPEYKYIGQFFIMIGQLKNISSRLYFAVLADQ